MTASRPSGRERLKRWVRSRAPAWLRHRLRVWNSLRLVRAFRAEQWPPALVARRLVRPGDWVVDAGANIGYVTRLLAEWVGPEGRVTSVEPEPGTFDVLRRMARALKWSRVELAQAAVSAAEAEGTLAVPQYAEGGENLYEARLVSDSIGAADGRKVSVRMTTLDALWGGREPPPSLIKLDVEGHEGQAVEGASRLLARARPAWLIEVSGDPWAADGPAARLFGRMRELGYQAYRSDAGRLIPAEKGQAVLDVFFLQPSHVERVKRTE